MQKILLVMLLLILSSCAIAVNDKNIVTVKLNNKMYEIIAKDTIDMMEKYITPSTSNLIVYSKQNAFLNNLEQHFRIAGYSIFVTPKEEIILKESDYVFSYILDMIDKSKVEKNIIQTLRYTFSINKNSCSKLYKVNNGSELLFKSDWVCLGE